MRSLDGGLIGGGLKTSFVHSFVSTMGVTERYVVRNMVILVGGKADVAALV